MVLSLGIFLWAGWEADLIGYTVRFFLLMGIGIAFLIKAAIVYKLDKIYENALVIDKAYAYDPVACDLCSTNCEEVVDTFYKTLNANKEEIIVCSACKIAELPDYD